MYSNYKKFKEIKKLKDEINSSDFFKAWNISLEEDSQSLEGIQLEAPLVMANYKENKKVTLESIRQSTEKPSQSL